MRAIRQAAVAAEGETILASWRAAVRASGCIGGGEWRRCNGGRHAPALRASNVDHPHRPAERDEHLPDVEAAELDEHGSDDEDRDKGRDHDKRPAMQASAYDFHARHADPA